MMNSSGNGINGNGNGHYPPGQGNPHSNISIKNNNQVFVYLGGNGAPAPTPTGSMGPAFQPETGHWQNSPANQPFAVVGMPIPVPTLQVQAPWNGHNGHSNALQAFGNTHSVIPGAYFSGQGGSGTQFMVPVRVICNGLHGAAGNTGQGAGAMVWEETVQEMETDHLDVEGSFCKSFKSN